MRRRSLYLTVAFLCCGCTSLFAQDQNIALRPQENAASPSDAIGELQAENDIPDPFSFLEGGNSEIPPLPPVADPAPEPNIAAPVLNIQPQAEIDPSVLDSAAPDPQSLPVRSKQPSNAVVDTMAAHDTIASVPNAAVTPVDWCYGEQRAPNHVADYLMRQECVDGLWDGYAAQRAAECAHMWKHLTAKKRCWCGHGCNNRYTASCDNCTHCAANLNAEAVQQAEEMAKIQPPTIR